MSLKSLIDKDISNGKLFLRVGIKTNADKENKYSTA